MRTRKTIWIAVIACATLLLLPALAEVLRAHEDGSTAAGTELSSPKQIDVPLRGIEYDPALSASYPVLARLEIQRMEALRRGAMPL